MNFRLKISLACSSLIAAATIVNVAYAYSIYPEGTGAANAGSTPQPDTSATTSSTFDVGGALNQLSAPFESFWNSMQTISPGDFSNFNPANTSIQIPSSVQGNLQALLAAVLTFFSWIFGWLKAASDWVAGLVTGWAK